MTGLMSDRAGILIQLLQFQATALLMTKMLMMLRFIST